MLDGDPGPVNAGFVACIGPVTAATARDLGVRVDLEAEVHTVDGLVDALTSHFSSESQSFLTEEASP